VARRLVLACVSASPELSAELPAGTERVPARPGKDEIDPRLAANPGVPLVVIGADADLAAVVLRLLRKGKLAETPVGFVPADPASEVARRWALPTEMTRALQVALDADAHPVPLVRDDAGGVLVGRGTFSRVSGVAYCDDHVALRGNARSIEVRPDPAEGLAVRVRRGLFNPIGSFTGRAFQIGCAPSRPSYDGVPHPRPVERWTWYRHTEDLLLIREPTRQ